MATTKITSPDLFDLGSLDTALKLPSGSTAERPTSPSTGEWRYNTTTNLVEFWDGGEWRDLQSEDIPPINSEHFNTVLYTGNGSTQSITGVGFKPDFVWIKPRNVADNHVASDSTRGDNKSLAPNTTATEQTTLGVTSFDADGFSLPNWGNVNSNGDTFVAWCWKANGGTTSSNTDGDITSTVQVNNKAGFSIVQYAGNGTNGQSVGHGLGTTPALIINKATTWQNAWGVWHQSIPGNATMYLQDNSTPGAVQLGTPNSTTFQTTHVGTYTVGTYINYCFKEVPGFSKFSSYTGNGSATGPVVNTGFEPAWLMLKRTDSAGSWAMIDNKRTPTNPRNKELFANLTDAENTFTAVNFLTNGFQIINTSNTYNANGGTYIYIAFAADASAAPVLADSFANKLYNGTGNELTVSGLGFQPSMSWLKTRNAANEWNQYDNVRGPFNKIKSNTTSAQEITGALSSFDSDGFTLRGSGYSLNQAGQNNISYNWKANPVPTINTDGTIQSIVSANQAAGFSILTWTGTGAQGTIGHGLSVAPELIISKRLDSTNNWSVYDKTLSLSHTSYPNWLYLNLNSSEQNSGSSANHPYYQEPSSTLIYQNTGTSESTNVNGGTYVSYCFASISGFSSIGTYTGNGSTQSITGVGFEPDWVLIRSTGSGNWMVYDNLRTVSVGDNPGTANARPYLIANNDGKENGVTSYNVNLDSDGFSMDTSAGDLNTNSQTYIYMAYKENPTPRPLAGNMSFLTIAGGGGGGNRHGGGAGAGGLRTSYGGSSGGGSSAESDITLAAGTYTITVGGGGAGVAYNTTAGVNGTNSVLSGSGMTTITSDGGGGGGISISPNIAGSAGGSGGGGGSTSTGGSATANQGKDGGQGTGQTAPEYGGGGGGGATLIGNNGSGSGGGNGGNGLAISITGSSVSYAGGGGGSSFATSTGGSGGDGGGGNGAGNLTTGQSGTANLGGGGGGTTYDGGFSGAGGSGVVILRLLTSEYSSSTTGSPTVTTDGDYTVLTYTGSGTYVHS